jgi:uncharacterized protein
MSELIDNRAWRLGILKGIIRDLHAGAPVAGVRERLATLVRAVDANEIAALEQELMAEGMPAEEVMEMCDLHSSVLGEILGEPPLRQMLPGHPVDTFRRENEALTAAARRAREATTELAGLPDEGVPGESLLRMRAALNDLLDVEKHYRRKENLLFSVLERHGISGPSKVMWGKDDEVRELLRAFDSALRAEGLTIPDLRLVVTTIGEPAVAAVEEMIRKEESILLPMALEALTEDDWSEVWEQSPPYGWCLVVPQTGYAPTRAVAPSPTVDLPPEAVAGFDSGALSFGQLRGLFGTLPVDLTFVDADDRVAFFSEGPDRVFARSRAIIGRKVQHCHPPASVHVVERIVDDFRNGRRSVAEFWITLHGRFVHIRYFAVRDAAGAYLGTLEVTQDLTRLRALTGERRLLEDDAAEAGV